MKNILKKLLPLLNSLFVSVIVVIALMYLFNSNYVWVQIFAPLSRFMKAELHSVMFIYAGIVLLSLAFNFKGRRLVPALVLLPIVIISISSWLNYEFYKDFLVFDSLLLLQEVSDGPPLSAFTVMESFPIAMFFLATSIVFLIFIFFLQSSKKLKLNKVVVMTVAGLCLWHGIGRAMWFNDEVGDLTQLSAPNQVHPFTHFLRSAVLDLTALPIKQEHVKILNELDERAVRNTAEGLSLNKQFISKNITSDTQNIIVIVMESVRAAETGYWGYDHGATPVLDSIAKDHLAFTNFYANSNQTVRAEQAILCGVLDYSSGAPFSVRGLQLNIDCVPKILAEKGYETLWFHGNEKNFFDRSFYLPQLGFKHIYDEDVIDKALNITEDMGWGTPDEKVFEFAIEKLSKVKEPFFAEILTVSNHYPFDSNFPANIESFDESPELYSAYLRAIRYTDYSIGVFWQWFENSPLKENTAVFIVSDHGLLIVSDKQKQANNYYKHEMQFKLPMIAVIPGLEADVDTSRVTSQLDIPATIFDLLNISQQSSYVMGGGIFDPEKNQMAVSTGFSNYVLRLDEKLCFPDASEEVLISETNHAYYDGLGIGKVNVVCADVDPNALRGFDSSDKSYSAPHKNYKDLTKIIDNFLTTGFRENAVDE